MYIKSLLYIHRPTHSHIHTHIYTDLFLHVFVNGFVDFIVQTFSELRFGTSRKTQLNIY